MRQVRSTLVSPHINIVCDVKATFLVIKDDDDGARPVEIVSFVFNAFSYLLPPKGQCGNRLATLPAATFACLPLACVAQLPPEILSGASVRSLCLNRLQVIAPNVRA